GIDQRLDLVVEDLAAEAGTDAAVDAAGGGDLDDIDAATDLQAHRPAAGIGTVAEIVLLDRGMQVLGDAEGRVHVAAGGRDRAAGVDDARALYPALRHRVAQRQCRAAAVAEIAYRGEAGEQGL